MLTPKGLAPCGRDAPRDAAVTLTGWGGRIGLARFRGACPKDGGRLRLYDKPVRWESDVTTGKLKVA